MAHHSVLTILPRFLWKPIFDSLSVIELKKLSSMRTFTNLFTDAYCKELILSNKTGKIKVIRANENRIDNFWIHAYNTYVEYDCLIDMMQSIRQKTKEFIYITVFIQPGKYDNHYYYDFGYRKCNISINGSKTGQTDFCSAYNQQHTYNYLPHCLSLKNIVYMSDCCINTYRHPNKTGSIILSNCIFNRKFFLQSTRHSTISNCTFNGFSIMSLIQYLTMSYCVFDCQAEYDVQHLVIIKCILNSQTNTVVYCNKDSTIEFNNNTITQTTSIMSLIGLKNNTIKIHNNIILDVDACISFYKYKPIHGENYFLMQNNSITNMPHKYNRINYAGVTINISKKINTRILSKCKFILDNSNTLTNCGFTVDADTKI